MSVRPEQQAAHEFSNRHFERFLEWGGQLLTREVVAVIAGPGRGNVLWGTEDNELAGHYINSSKIDEDSQLPLKHLGFTEAELSERFWIIKSSRYDVDRGEIRDNMADGITLARWSDNSWQAAHYDRQSSLKGEANSWSVLPNLSNTEQNALKPVVQEGEVILDAALTLGENRHYYSALRDELEGRAARHDDDSISILIEPWKHNLGRLESSVNRLEHSASILHKILTDQVVMKPPSDEVAISGSVASEDSMFDPAQLLVHARTLLPSFPEEWTNL